MPKNTFYKIKEEKQNHMINIGKILFSQNYFENVDVKMIVEAASIPRGSFYAYFDSIKDYYLTVIKSLQLERMEEVKIITNDSSLSFFGVLLKLYINDIQKSLLSDKKLLVQHYFRYIMTQNLGFLESNERPIYEILNVYNKEFNLDNIAWLDFLELSMNTYLFTYIKAIESKLEFDACVDLFKNRIKILERGIKWLLYHLLQSQFC